MRAFPDRRKRPEDVYSLALERVSPVVGATFACVYVIR
jgi:hypothetical protein